MSGVGPPQDPRSKFQAIQTNPRRVLKLTFLSRQITNKCQLDSLQRNHVALIIHVHYNEVQSTNVFLNETSPGFSLHVQPAMRYSGPLFHYHNRSPIMFHRRPRAGFDRLHYLTTHSVRLCVSINCSNRHQTTLSVQAGRRRYSPLLIIRE